jgi:hypothetical protein
MTTGRFVYEEALARHRAAKVRRGHLRGIVTLLQQQGSDPVLRDAAPRITGLSPNHRWSFTQTCGKPLQLSRFL